MNILQKPKIGLVGLMCTPFRGDKEGNYRSHRAMLNALASDYDFHFYPLENGIYSKDQAEAAAKEMDAWGADFILLQSASFAAGDFIYPFMEIRSGLGVWAIPEGGTHINGELPLNSFTGMNLNNSLLRSNLNNYNRPVKWFWGNPGQEMFDRRFLVTVQALRAVVNLREARIGLIGGVAPSFDNLIVDEKRLKQRLGVSVVNLELDEVFHREQGIDIKRVDAAVEDIRSTSVDIDPSMNRFLQKSGRTITALSDIAEEKNLTAIAISCWPLYQTQESLAICTVVGHLNTRRLIVACEGDVAAAVSMYALKCMTNGNLVTLMDLATIDPQDESVLLWHCGPTSPSLADDRGTRMESLALFDDDKNNHIGLRNDLILKPGQATILGFTADFQRMLLLGGEIDNQKPSYKGSRGWFRNIKINGDDASIADLVQTIMVSGYQHHYPLAYGDLINAGMELCGWTGIQPIKSEEYTEFVK